MVYSSSSSSSYLPPLSIFYLGDHESKRFQTLVKCVLRYDAFFHAIKCVFKKLSVNNFIHRPLQYYNNINDSNKTIEPRWLYR